MIAAETPPFIPIPKDPDGNPRLVGAPANGRPLESTNLPLRNQTILLAEDDDDLRLVMTYFLERIGLTVIACPDAFLASEAFRYSPTISLLMTDYQMPGRSGMELAHELTALRPSLPVLIVSATIFSDKMLAEVREQRWMFLSKPCQMRSLIDTIHLLLKRNWQFAA